MPDGSFEFSSEPFRAGPAGPRAAARSRVFLYSHDTFGLGHLRRNLAIAEQLLASDDGCEVWLLSGSPVIRRWDLPAGLWVQPLPPVVKVGAERYVARGGVHPFGLVKGYREALILNAVMRERPDVIVIDHAPAGMKNELLPMLAAVRQEMPDTRVVLGLRDIIDAPEVVCRLWQEEETYELLEHAYDQIMVYGSRDLFDLAASYRLPSTVAAKLRYVGYVGRPAAARVDAPWPGLEAAPGKRVLVTAGGGGDGYGMMLAYLNALASLPVHATASLLVPGPLMPHEQVEALRHLAAARPDVGLLPFTTDLVHSVARADLVVGMGGYNTVSEILAANKPAIIVPRAAPRVEQLLRARLLERLGLVRVAEEGADLAARLAAMLPVVLAEPAPPARRAGVIDLDGARRAAAAIADLAATRSPAPVPAAPAPVQAAPTPAHGRRVAYVMKRYPRLSETFILNEICAMEELGERLEIYSLLPPEPPPHHPMVSRVAAPVHHLPLTLGRKLAVLARAHAASLAAAPLRYAGAVGRAALWSVQSPNPLSVWKQFLRAGFLATLCRERGITHIHAHFANAPAAVARFASVMSGRPFSFTTHAKDLYLTPAKVIRKRVNAAAFVVTCTHHNVEYLRQVLPAESHRKVNLIYHGIDLSRFRYRVPRYSFLALGAEAQILCVARLVAKKGLDDLIAACAILAAQGQRFRCRIVGAGPLRETLAADIAARGLDGVVTLEGAMTHDNLIGLFAQADLFALAPRITDDGDRDGIPNVIVEAMATGVPVVSTAVSGVPELVEHERTGLLVPPNDPAALAAAMARLLIEPMLGQRLAAAARSRLDGCFDCWQNTRALRGLVGSLVCEAVTPSLADADAEPAAA